MKSIGRHRNRHGVPSNVGVRGENKEEVMIGSLIIIAVIIGTMVLYCNLVVNRIPRRT